ncbi:M17 family metallopeptidase [Reinekea marinisedimentorum]|uniref:Leucyl aminopeptidase/proline iminopeptidase n=1 Tax=Reinekea marinisedimentorum TaxID=230495 RepID=A0A4R3HV49_9GAMM|nr:leucyl aminopeptidase family protein [Reinekea marinisedimentorum]TCS35925.1 leucyl aminopeptidase/proline iminopeptidase [Reinekea marinisedimentorum]
MKKFDYPQFDVSVVAQLPEDADSCIEWSERSQQPFIVQQLKGERSLRTLLPDGRLWSYRRAPAMNLNAFEYLTLARAVTGSAIKATTAHVAIIADREELLDALLCAVLAAQYKLPRFGKKDGPNRDLRISLVGSISAERVAQRLAEAEGNAFARFLTVLPANELTPASYRAMVEQLAETEGWDCRVYSYKELEQMGAGAFVSVARGSNDAEAAIVRVQYQGDPESARNIALVGKGVTIDTGGYNLKTGGSMFGMNGDMAGSAVALGSLMASSLANEKVNITAWLALTENHIGPQSYHANEWVRALNGTTIEIVDTDAEGRMILADTLTLASRERPQLVVDYATLTGACVGALSTRYSGVFTNNEDWIMPLISAGKASGERIWPFPLDVDYDENIKSSVADIQQCNPGKSSDHIDAARFLSRFVEQGVHWVHLDLSAAKHKGGLAHVPTDVTGFGVRLTQQLIKTLG